MINFYKICIGHFQETASEFQKPWENKCCIYQTYVSLNIIAHLRLQENQSTRILEENVLLSCHLSLKSVVQFWSVRQN